MNLTKRSFGSGEISPALSQRTTLQTYQDGLQECTNFIIKVEGGVYSRGGLYFIGELGDSTRRGRLVPFSFNTEQNYILVFEHQKMYVVKDGAFVINSADEPNLYVLDTTYNEDMLSRLIFVQDADVMTITHPERHPRTLSRLAHDNWVLADVNFASTTVAPGAAVLSEVGAGPTTTHTKDYHYVVTAVDDFDVESLPSPVGSINAEQLSPTFGVRINWADVPGALYYRVYKDPSNGSGIYGWIGNTSTSVYDDYNVGPVLADSPPNDYQPFDGANAYPSTVGYFDQRTLYANSIFEPQTVWATQVGNYNSLRTSDPPRDDDSLEFTLKNQSVNEIRHIVSLDALVLLTSSAEWIFTGGPEVTLTPTTLGFRPRSRYGASWCRPAAVGDSIVYVQEKGNRLRDLTRSTQAEQFTGTDLTVLARHLFRGFEIEEIAYAEEPYSIVWGVRSDGALLGMTYQRENNVVAWHKHTTQGAFESVAVIREADEDAVYVIVKRTINGVERRFVERMEAREEENVEDAFCVDCGLSYEGAPEDTVDGLEHLIGETVQILADGYQVSDQVVDDEGMIHLPDPASKIHIGLQYTPRIVTLGLDQDELGNVANLRTISKIMMAMEKSRGGHVATVNDEGETGDFEELAPRLESDAYDTIPLRTFKQEVQAASGWNLSGAVCVEQRSPLPLAILSVTLDVDIG